MDRFLALKVFTKVVECGGFAAAARALDLGPASVTEHIKALEKHLKTKLLNRTTRSMALTDEGAAYYEHACQILTRMEEADAMLTAQRVSPQGVLRVAMPQLMGTMIVLPQMPAFLERYPGMRVEFTLSAQAPSFSAQNLDLAIQISADIEPGLVFRPFGLTRLWTVATPVYLAKRGTPRTPEDLEGHEVIGIRAVPGIPAQLLFERDRQMIMRDSNARLTADSGVAQVLLGLQDFGIFQGTEYAIDALVKEGKLVRILQDWDWSGPPVGAVHPPNRFLQPKVGVFLDFVQQLLMPKLSPFRPDWVKA